MKIRNILFGYCYDNGAIVISEKEAEIVKEVFNKYFDGISLLQLTRELSERKIEYMPGVCTWNKAKIMRLLEDRKYIGEDGYPRIIERELFEAVQGVKAEKSNKLELDKTADIFQMTIPLVCPKCNRALKRKADYRLKNPIQWRCLNKDCHFSKKKDDQQLFEELTQLLNIAIENPATVVQPQLEQPETIYDLPQIDNEITQLCANAHINADLVKEKIFNYASLKYSNVNSSISRTQRLKDVFTSSPILKTFSLKLLERTVDKIIFYEDCSLGIVLENGKEITKEVSSYAVNGI